jgi:hypothetical protein
MLKGNLKSFVWIRIQAIKWRKEAFLDSLRTMSNKPWRLNVEGRQILRLDRRMACPKWNRKSSRAFTSCTLMVINCTLPATKDFDYTGEEYISDDNLSDSFA